MTANQIDKFDRADLSNTEGAQLAWRPTYQRLADAVGQSGLKQKFIADKLGLTEMAVSTMLTGRRKISVDDFFGICSVIRRDPSEVYNQV